MRPARTAPSSDLQNQTQLPAGCAHPRAGRQGARPDREPVQATGTNEELQHQIQIQNDKIDQMQKDFAYRLCTAVGAAAGRRATR